MTFGTPIDVEKHFKCPTVTLSDEFDVNFVCYISQLANQLKLNTLTYMKKAFESTALQGLHFKYVYQNHFQ